MLDTKVSGPFRELSTTPSSPFVRHQFGGDAKVLDPASLEALDQVGTTLGLQERCHLVFGGGVDHRQNWKLVVANLQPENVSLNTFSQLSGSLSKSRW